MTPEEILKRDGLAATINQALLDDKRNNIDGELLDLLVRISELAINTARTQLLAELKEKK